MQVLLSAEHTIFKINATAQEYQKLTGFINKYFDAKNLAENIIFIPMTKSTQENRRFLMKWLYSYYKKDTKNFNPKLQLELVKRMNNPVHIQFLEQKHQYIKISVTFYENAICQIALDRKDKEIQEYLIYFFAGLITIKSSVFNLYELKMRTQKDKELLAFFLEQKELKGVAVNLEYDKFASEHFLCTDKRENQEPNLEKAFKILRVNRTDSFSSIKKTYKKLAKTYHPDLSALEYEESTKQFQILSDAFHLIKKYKAVA